MWRKKQFTSFRQNKYGARRTRCALHAHNSGLEAKTCQELQLREKAGDIKSFEVEVDIPLMVNDQKIAIYRADFIVTHQDGSKEVVEAKGMILPVFRLKWRILEATRPDLKLTMVTR